jgi:hydroxymethylpyrimidine kinase/phosphomethylpyrimidine kinase
MTAAKFPCVLAIGGLDPGGGAGILADARAIEFAGAFACAVVAAQTIQSTRGLVRTDAVAPKLWVEQARVVLRDQRVRAIKTGALGDAANVRAMVRLARAHPKIPLVVDPVMIPTRGAARLLDASALDAMRELVAHAALVTANADEAVALTGERVTTTREAHRAAKALVALGARAALVKGGHIAGADSPRAVDVLVTRKTTTMLSRRRIATPRALHGAGCALASLIAARIALGDEIERAARYAKRVHHNAIARAVDVGEGLLVLRQ